jgi:sterol desaturase/sphingolipid hydroxylase (fatty acid hydroxylase superfamily)
MEDTSMNSIFRESQTLQELYRIAVDLYPGIFAFDLLRYLIGAGGVFLIINLLLAKVLSARKIRSEKPGIRQMAGEIAASMRTVLIFSLTGLFIAFGAERGWMPIYLDPAERGWIYFTANILLLILAHDAWFYWMHRLMHRVRTLRKFHMLHHRSFNPSPWAAYSFDSADALANAVFFPLALFILPTSALAAFVFTAHMIIRNAIGHCGYEIFPARRDGRPLFCFLTSVTHHDLHHEQAGWNFGLYFTFWDRLMGTENPNYLPAFAKAAARKTMAGALPGSTMAGE